MSILLNLLMGVLEQGLIYAPLALGMYISYTILNIPDLTVEGSFPLGGAVTAVCLQAGWNPWLAIVAGTLAGGLAGVISGIIHVKLKLSAILSTLIVMTSLYSINIVLTGSSNVPLFSYTTIFSDKLAELIPEPLGPIYPRVVVVSTILVIIVKLVMDLVLNSRFGYMLRATGDEPQVVISLGRDPGNYTIAGLGIANGLVALSGAVLTQQQEVFDVGMGTGSMVVAIGSVIMGLSLFGKRNGRRGLRPTTAVILGSILYKLIIAIALRLGLDTDLLKLAQGVLFLIILLLSNATKSKGKSGSGNRKNGGDGRNAGNGRNEGGGRNAGDGRNAGGGRNADNGRNAGDSRNADNSRNADDNVNTASIKAQDGGEHA